MVARSRTHLRSSEVAQKGTPQHHGEWLRNQSRFYGRFNAVVLLSAPADVILDRVARRTTNDYGKSPVERATILDDLATVEPLLRAGGTHELDAPAGRSTTSSPT